MEGLGQGLGRQVPPHGEPLPLQRGTPPVQLDLEEQLVLLLALQSRGGGPSQVAEEIGRWGSIEPNSSTSGTWLPSWNSL